MLHGHVGNRSDVMSDRAYGTGAVVAAWRVIGSSYEQF